MNGVEDAAVPHCTKCNHFYSRIRFSQTDIGKFARAAARANKATIVDGLLRQVATSKAALAEERRQMSSHLTREHEVTP